MSEETLTNNLLEFAYIPNRQGMLDYLEELAIKESWNYKNQNSNTKNTKNPILWNYIFHTFKRLVFERNNLPEDKKNKKIFIKGDIACFNTGLFTPKYQYIYALFEKNTLPSAKFPWILKGFYEEYHQALSSVSPLPERAKYFEHISDLLFDTSLDRRINIPHILDNPKNRDRIPLHLQNASNLLILFEGAVRLAMKKIEANYKVAVPQYYQDKIQLLIPISLDTPEKVDLALAVEKSDEGYYTGHTCLTIDMAYNNARLIARPDSDWLKP